MSGFQMLRQTSDFCKKVEKHYVFCIFVLQYASPGSLQQPSQQSPCPATQPSSQPKLQAQINNIIIRPVKGVDPAQL